MIIEKVYCMSDSGLRWEHAVWEMVDYYPADEPLIDLFDLPSGDDPARCPCGEWMPVCGMFSELRETAETHIAKKHSAPAR